MIQINSDHITLIILEPGNIRKMKALQPLQVKIPEGCKEIGFVLCNDIEFVEQEIRKVGKASIDMIEEIMKEDLKRPSIDRSSNELEGISRTYGI